MSVIPIRRWSAGDASSSRTTTAPMASGTGRRMTPPTRRDHRPLPSSRSRPKNGIRPRLTPSPRIASVAGRKVRLPTTATNTTPIVPIAIDRKIDTSMMNSPASAIITASPLKNTARPAVALAISMASSLSRPCRRSDRKRVIMNSE